MLLKKVINIFIRVSGAPLQPANMLFSIATTQWKSMNAREEIDKLVKEINRTGDKYVSYL